MTDTPNTTSPSVDTPDDDDTAEPVTLAVSVDLALDTEARTITGLVLPLGVIADRTSAGPIVFTAGSIRHHPDLSRIKLLIDHDTSKAVGHATRLDITDTAVTATFKVGAGPDGDEALAKAAEKVRDGLSVGADIRMRHRAADGSHDVVTQAVINEVSLVALPAFTDSRVTTVTASAQQPAPLPPSQENTTMPTNEPTSTETAPVTDPIPVTAGDGSAPAVTAATTPQPPAPYTAATSQPATLSEGAQQIAATFAAGGGASEIRAVVGRLDATAALADVIPSNDAGNGFIGRPGFLGELWEARQTTRPIMEAFGPIGTLTRLKETGWKWQTRPEVGTYAGDKAEIPSNTVATVPVEVTAERTAGGWDVDRAFVDLGDADMIEALFEAAIEDYLVKSETWATTKVLAAATAVPAQADLATALVTLGTQAGGIGASLGVISFATDVWAEFLGMTRAELPWWINPNSSVQIDEGTVQIGSLRLNSNPSLAAGSILAGDRRAVTFKEARVRVNAIDLPKGGVDLGVFAYHSCRVNDARALFSTSITTEV